MFNGIIYFKFTPKGYVVDDFYESFFADWPNRIGSAWGKLKLMRIEGSFNFTPKRGQFCKRPHKLIAWS